MVLYCEFNCEWRRQWIESNRLRISEAFNFHCSLFYACICWVLANVSAKWRYNSLRAANSGWYCNNKGKIKRWIQTVPLNYFKAHKILLVDWIFGWTNWMADWTRIQINIVLWDSCSPCSIITIFEWWLLI